MRRLVTTTHIEWAGGTWLLGCAWSADGDGARIDGVQLLQGDETPAIDAVLAAGEAISRQLVEGKRIETLAAMVEDDESAYALAVRAVAEQQAVGAEAAAYGIACQRSPL